MPVLLPVFHRSIEEFFPVTKGLYKKALHFCKAFFVENTGFEPVASSLPAKRSSQMS